MCDFSSAMTRALEMGFIVKVFQLEFAQVTNNLVKVAKYLVQPGNNFMINKIFT
jgi:hypothetical protein